MKKVMMLAIFGLIITTSCNKTYECECEIKDDRTGQLISRKSNEVTTSSKKKAENECSTVTSNGITSTCTLR